MDILDEMAAIEAASASSRSKAKRELIPSPRGIQDFLVEFPTVPETTQDPGHPPPPLSQAYIDESKYRPATSSQQTTFLPLPSISSDDISSPNANSCGFSFAFSRPAVVVPTSSYGKEDAITPWLDEHSAQPPPGNNNASVEEQEEFEIPALPIQEKYTYTRTCEMEPEKIPATHHSYRESISEPQRVHGKVMPPTAKSILERRERAIREGRRHEAKLSSEERRILRRLRNRESAERCAKRKAEEADLLARKIDELERENARLRSVAAQFETAVSKLEQYFAGKLKSTSVGRDWSAEHCPSVS